MFDDNLNGPISWNCQTGSYGSYAMDICITGTLKTQDSGFRNAGLASGTQKTLSVTDSLSVVIVSLIKVLQGLCQPERKN